MTEEQPSTHKTGYVAVMGQPNVGKSTLINALMGQKIAAVSPKPQTTRKQQLGILTLEGAQIIFMDTPGVHKPHHKLGQRMNYEAESVLDDGDLVLMVVDASRSPNEQDHMLAELVRGLRGALPVILALNKVDMLADYVLPARTEEYQALASEAHTLPISAIEGANLGQLVEAILERLPLGPPFYPEEQVTDTYERDIAADLVREAALINLRDEVPHAIAVRMDEFTERENGVTFISATLLVERESQKGIVVGRKGAMIKQIGAAARKEIEAMSGRKVYLELRVKVRKNWRNDDKTLRQFGFRKRGG